LNHKKVKPKDNNESINYFYSYYILFGNKSDLLQIEKDIIKNKIIGVIHMDNIWIN
jgi:hypothetical protein